MDFSPLKNESFDVNSWIRQMFTDLPEDADLETIFERFSTELDVEISKTTAQINALSQQVVAQVPRVAREFEQTHKEVNKLQEEITSGFNEAENVQKKTTASMTTLERLDNVKTNLLATSSALQEADKFTSLGKEVDQLLDSGDVFKSFDCILGMEKSLAVLDESTSEERKLILEEVKNRLEALATKHIIQAFETNDIDSASRFFIMFSKLERTTQYIKYFENSEKIKLTQEWRNYVELLSFREAITKFYDDLMDHLRSKVQWCKVIFTENSDEFALNVLLGLYTETIRMMEPSVQYCFDVESRKEPFLELLLQFNQITHRFVQNLRQYIEASCNATPKAGVILDFLKVLFAPFIPQYAKYSTYHEKLVVSKIQEAFKGIVSTSAAGNMVGNVDSSAMLQERIDCAKRLLPEIVLSVKEGEEKILLLNHGYGYYHFGRGINAGLEKFRDWCFEVYKILEATTTGYHPEKQRSLLENSLSFGEACGEILQQVVQLDAGMTANCSRVISKLSLPNSSGGGEWEAFSEIYLDNSLLQEVTKFIQKKETLLSSAINQLKKLCKDTTQLILKVTAQPIETQLKKNFVLSDCNLKEAIPSEYITQVGEYLMLLPQNLDPFISSEASSLAAAFDHTGEDDTKSPVDYILSNISVSICEAYTERLLKITFLSEGQGKQLAQDIDYLGSVLEDLGGKLTQDLVDFSKLMKMYSSINSSTSVDKVSPRILNIVKKMRITPPVQ